MPMYEYGCLSCNNRFDRLRQMSQGDAGVTCPVCHSESVQRRISVFASHTKGASSGGGGVAEAAAPTSGSCGRGCPGCGCGTRN